MGNERWVSKFDNIFHEEFASSQPTPWTVKDSGRVAGTVRTAGGNGHTAGNVTFLIIHEAGLVNSSTLPFESVLKSSPVIWFHMTNLKLPLYVVVALQSVWDADLLNCPGYDYPMGKERASDGLIHYIDSRT